MNSYQMLKRLFVQGVFENHPEIEKIREILSYEEMHQKTFHILLDKDNQPIGIDTNSGGYPWAPGLKSPNHIEYWRNEKEMGDYKEIFRKEGFKKATITLIITPED